MRLRIDDCHYEKINKAFAQTHTGRVGSAARTDIAVPCEVRMIILYGSYARGEYVIWDETYDERVDLLTTKATLIFW